jgi:hypothetical protein
MLKRVPNSVGLALFLCLLIGFGFAVCDASKHQPQRIQINAEQKTKNSIEGQNGAKQKISTARNTERDSQTDQRYEEAGSGNIFGIRRGEAVLGFITFLLFMATVALVLVARETAKRQLRAYVGLGADDFSLELPGETDPHYAPIDLSNPNPQIFNDFLVIKVKNFGQTPASNVVVFGSVSVTQGAFLLPEKFFDTILPDRVDPNNRTFTSKFVLQPQQSATSKHAMMDVRQIIPARQRHATVFVWGHIYYRDIYERSWRTMFCYVWEPWHTHGARFVPYDKHNGEDQATFE